MQRTTFRLHGLHRLQERTCLEPHQVTEFIDDGKSIPLGREEGTFRVHHLFFSEKDSALFVAVWDEETHEVITILPMSHHHAWPISLEAQELAKRLMRGERDAEKEVPTCRDPNPTDPNRDRVLKYGFQIGRAKKAVAVGSLFVSQPRRWAELLFTAHFSFGPRMRGYGTRGVHILVIQGSPRYPSLTAYLADTEMCRALREKILEKVHPQLPSYLDEVTVQINKGMMVHLNP